MHSQQHALPRRKQPELELAASRITSLGYEAAENVGFIRCLDHGYPTPLARWHYHDEYELHLIVATSGKAFVGDYIGQFQPGHLVLTGPRLPHNWISMDVQEGGVPLRDRVLQFHHDAVAKACGSIAELAEVLPLLERARNGIEFMGMFEDARIYFERIKTSRGLERLAAFCEFMSQLSRCTDYRLLSTARLQSFDDETSLEWINSVVDQITDNPAQSPSMSDFAAQLNMTESQFSRFFRRTTGNNFIDFVSRVRVSRACLLLMETDRLVTHICYDVGFNNIANFNRRFREIKGMTPREFRRQAGTRFGR
ncbi:MAG: AraC family transcriptional regulator [Betaproteobacteria bacterium]